MRVRSIKHSLENCLETRLSGEPRAGGEATRLVPLRLASKPDSPKPVRNTVPLGEPNKIDVSILHFTGDPNATLELVDGFGHLRAKPVRFRRIAHHYATR